MENLAFKTRKQIADEYGISIKTLTIRLKKEGIELPLGNVTPKYLRMIYDLFGMPHQIKGFNVMALAVCGVMDSLANTNL